MICFKEEKYDKLVRQLSWLGIDKDTYSRSDDKGSYKWRYDVPNLGFKYQVTKQVERLVKIAKKANLYGVICSPNEIKMIKKIAPQLKCFTPGIRQDKKKDDQKRTMNAKEAFEAGSDCLIIGRPITKGNPKKNIKKILSSLN